MIFAANGNPDLKIKWTEPACGDLQQIETYVQKEWPTGAILTHFGHHGSWGHFKRTPQIWPYSEDWTGTRELVFGQLPYFLVYRIKGDTIEILRALHSSRKWP